MRVLIVYDSRHGATAGIAGRIRAVLDRHGIDADQFSAADARDRARDSGLDAYDAFVIGSAIYADHWLGEAREFVRQNARRLHDRPVWLFGSGPLGDKTTDDKGKDLLRPTAEMADLAGRVDARGSRVFFGAYDPSAKPIGILERFVRWAPAGESALPVGDFRDWPNVEQWAQEIANELKQPVAAGASA